MLAELRRLEYPIVFIRPGTDLPRDADDRQTAENMRPLVVEAARLGFAVGVCPSIPDVSGVRLSAAAAAMLVEGPGGERIVAAKVTQADYESSTLEFLQHPALARLKIVQGWDTFLARAFTTARDSTPRAASGAA